MKTLLSDGAPGAGSCPTGQKAKGQKAQRPRPVRLGHIHKSVSPFNQHPPGTRRPDRPCPRARPAGPTRPAQTAGRPGTNQFFSERRHGSRNRNTGIGSQRPDPF
jgi:hypothetical protein